MVERAGLLLADDPWLARRLDRLGDEVGLHWLANDPTEPPAVVVIDLSPDNIDDQVRKLRERWPGAILAGYLGAPDPERWLAGQRAGCDLVSNRGALVSRLRPLLLATDRSAWLFPVLSEADMAGRLGLVARISESPVGPIAVYQIEGDVHVVSDICPHAGALLSEGEVDDGVVTCPLHGSQFDVRNGERVRGPADAGISTCRVIVANGQVSIAVAVSSDVRH